MLSAPGDRPAGRVRVTADRLLSPTKEVRSPLNSINAAKRVAGKTSGVAEKNFAQNHAENKTQELP
jgi:hypothetical protein